MEYLILGMLMLSPMTGYELQQFIKKNLALICSHSAGSVQSALTKLERDGKVSVCQTAQGRRQKKIFSITQQGRRAFAQWVGQPMQADKGKNMELSRLFFAGLAAPEERIAAIRDYIGQIQQSKAVLTMIREHFANMRAEELPPGTDWEEVLRFQGYTLEYGIAAAEFEIGWYTGLLQELEGQSHGEMGGVQV